MSKDIASLNPSDVLDTTAKFFRVMEKEGVEWAHYRRPIDSRAARRNLADYLKTGCPKVREDGTVLAVSTGHEPASRMLGRDFITPEEVAERRELVYSSEQLVQLAETLPSEEDFRWLKEHDYLLLPGPPTPLSLLDIRDLRPELFWSKDGGWYAEVGEKFSRDDKV